MYAVTSFGLYLMASDMRAKACSNTKRTRQKLAFRHGYVAKEKTTDTKHPEQYRVKIQHEGSIAAQQITRTSGEGIQSVCRNKILVQKHGCLSIVIRCLKAPGLDVRLAWGDVT